MKFIHFGCWNNDKCSQDGTNGISKMTKLLRNETTKNTYDFISVAGDNYYPAKNKSEGIKKMNVENLISGFECLPQNIDKYVLFGNHDIEDKIGEDDGSITNCKALLLQKERYSTGEYKLFDDMIIKETDSTLILLIDTTLYDIDLNTNVQDSCYKHIFSNTKFTKLEELANYQRDEMIKIINSKPKKNIIIIGHHPLFSIVTKKDKSKNKPHDNLIQLFRDLSIHLQGKNIFYLCADTHYYQQSVITLNGCAINQYIVGTGGAEQDDLPNEQYQKEYNGITYEIIEQYKNFGFIEVDINSDINSDIHIKFHNADTLEGANYNYYKKYLKYKAKYLKLKQ
jgi:hypothetical protein